MLLLRFILNMADAMLTVGEMVAAGRVAWPSFAGNRALTSAAASAVCCLR
jgi:hypothetical protein